MSSTAIRRPSAAGFGIFTLILIVVFVGLGIWQLQRRVEKHALIAQLDARLAAAPEALPQPSVWPTLTSAKDEFRRVIFTATYTTLPDAMVYGSGSAVRADISGPGTWVFLPAKLPSGETVVVNGGFVQNTMQDRSFEDRVVGRLVTGQPVTLTGYIRFPERPGRLTPAENVPKRLWFVRDHRGMAQALGWGEVAPFYIDLEAPVPDSGTPKPGPLQVHLRDDHMQYAITWFSLAAAVLIAFGAWWRGQRRRGA
ncbi:SURF1 family protein [Bradyrhizobium sp. ISRA443]|uniref:SURF1 family protein n=1 Tax=unclassified Bradyrhizobium TaxID=2631580 RepID=UPI00247B2595|nr:MULTISPECIES: SURF1 family cytochrome oxidase biogenesis protein [unclassified Bradyrhizobium]WGR98678.1 SURF1 family protein [Bradyrhizobium sp. ISRA436]WGS05567.1 SURF1 family protein [Bradyrhizobium sp. ISRA437]WGS12454.1 SURF1 family protein [Bradyrhizobium sp. ISRA443]